MENKAIIVNKYEIIERCINRINEEYNNDVNSLEDYRRQDCILLNLQRACQAVIDIASYMVSVRKLGMAQTKAELFELLYINKLIDKEMANNLKNMVAFRNIAVHDYKNVETEIVIEVIEKHLENLKEFARKMIAI